MIDLHCHILPAIDDGPQNIEGSLDMCRAAVSDGIKTIVATPHFKPGLYQLPTEAGVRTRLELLNEQLLLEGLNLKILPGAEVRLTSDIYAYLETEEFITLNSTGKYMLTEFPMGSLPDDWEGLLAGLIERGVTPVIAHPERSDAFLSEPELLYDVVRMGALTQLTAESVTGAYGFDIQRFCEKLLRDDVAHVIATDSHSVEFRAPQLTDAVTVAASIIGEEKALALVTKNPEAIIKGDPL
ncbi:MAG: CpsB/CapC family capsule biosynthesis tyrosine phosphatase [Thermodesulfobacteriota bacterium]